MTRYTAKKDATLVILSRYLFIFFFFHGTITVYSASMTGKDYKTTIDGDNDNNSQLQAIVTAITF